MTWMIFAPSQSKQRAKIQNIDVSKTRDQNKKIMISNPCQEPLNSKASNEDLKDIDVICSFEIKIDS